MIYMDLPNGRRVSWLIISLGVGGVVFSIIGLGVAVVAPEKIGERMPALLFCFALASFFTIALPLPSTWRAYNATMQTAIEREQTAQAREQFERALFLGWVGGGYVDPTVSEETDVATAEQSADGREVKVNSSSGATTIVLPVTEAQRKQIAEREALQRARAAQIARWRYALSTVLAWAMLRGGLRVADLVGPALALSSNSAHTVITDELVKMRVATKENGSPTTLVDKMTYQRAIMIVNDPTAYRLSAYEFPQVDPPRVREVPKATL